VILRSRQTLEAERFLQEGELCRGLKGGAGGDGWSLRDIRVGHAAASFSFAAGAGDWGHGAGQEPVCELKKQGEKVCRTKALRVTGDPLITPGRTLDMLLRGNKSILERIAAIRGKRAIWKLLPVCDTDSCRGFNDFVHYFEEKQRVGIIQTEDLTMVLVPPIESFLNVLNVRVNQSPCQPAKESP